MLNVMPLPPHPNMEKTPGSDDSSLRTGKPVGLSANAPAQA